MAKAALNAAAKIAVVRNLVSSASGRTSEDICHALLDRLGALIRDLLRERCQLF
jgi:hypothetical protein